MKSTFICLLLVLPSFVFGQTAWPSPEIGQMYRNADDDIARGNYKDAITICRQAILLAPHLPVFTNQMAVAYYLSGDYNQAETTLNKLERQECDTQCFRLLAASQAALKKIKQSEKTMQSGIDLFPGSGSLYHEKGIICTLAGKEEEAINAWQDGMEHDPGFAPDYYDAATACISSGNVLRGLIYGEIFLAMKHDTVADTALKNKLYAGYQAFFEKIADNGKPDKKQQKTTFEDAVLKTYTMLTPVVSDGITTENLVMVRTRFLMDWFAGYSEKYPFPLFSYLDEMIATGHFDVYNQWLFGAAENSQQYDAWNRFHEGDMARFEEWKAANPFIPAGFSFGAGRLKEKQ